MPAIHVVTDSGSDLVPELIAEHPVTVVPLTVRFGEEELAESTPKEFWACCRQTSVMPETAAPSPGAFATAFRQAAAAGATGVVCVTLSGRLSATIQSAQAAANEVAPDIPVRVVDSLNASFGQGLQVLAAARVAEAGADLDDVVRHAEALVPRIRVFAALDTLENLKRGGRIGGAQALVGSVLSIKPIVQIVGGRVEQESRQRTRSRALRYLADKVTAAAAAGEVHELAVIHGDAGDLDDFLAMITTAVPTVPTLVGLVGPVIGTHSGPGVVGCAWVVPTPA
jgi:DegV family protein with EDD domain